jgi:light-regulated signal transduction histidine kinase (bacteriophytochrome)
MLRSKRGTILLQLFFATAVALIIAVGLVSIAFVRSYARTVEQLVLTEDLPRAMAALAASARPAAVRLSALIAASVTLTIALLAVVYRQLLREIRRVRDGERALSVLTSQLRQRSEAAEAANRELEAFSYSVSHDLRAPLRSVDGFSLALLEDYGAHLDEQAQSHLVRIRNATTRMARLIDDLLQLSRINRGELAREDVDVSALAERVVADRRRQEPTRSVAVTIQPKMTASADPRLLRIVLENLIENAWKFTGRREHAAVEVGCQRSKNETAFYVRDDGAGFDPAYADKLFGAFQRLHAVADFPGTGIGLATVQRIIHRHGGRVWAEGGADRGACFSFTIEPPPINEEQ